MERLKDPRTLMQEAKAGNNSAFGKLYELYYVPVFRYVYIRLRDKDEAQDLVQTVFLKVYKSIEKYEDENKEPLPYFFTVARNSIIDYFRKKRSVSLNENVEIESNQEDPEGFAQRREEEKVVNEAIKSLKGDQKEVILLKYISGFSNSQIAESLNKSEEAIRQIQHRAFKVLRNKLKNI